MVGSRQSTGGSPQSTRKLVNLKRNRRDKGSETRNEAAKLAIL